MSDTASPTEKQDPAEIIACAIGYIVAEHVVRLNEIDAVSRRIAQTAVNTLHARGYVIVPREPTKEMAQVGYIRGHGLNLIFAAECWRRMIDAYASPTQSREAAER